MKKLTTSGRQPSDTSDMAGNDPSVLIPETLSRSRIREWLVRNAGIVVPILLALAIAAFFLGRHIFDGTVPAEGDVRSHIFKIEFLQSYLSDFSWPQWNPWWYHGIPEDQFYPPGFYFLGAVLTYIFGQAVISYKILLLLVMVLNGLSIFYLARRFFKFDTHLAIWCLVAYEASTPLLLNFLYGEGPNLLGWSVTIFFMTIYLNRIMENQTGRLIYAVWPGFLLGVSILIHPFPVIFAFVALVLFHIVWLAHTRSFRGFVRQQLPYIAVVFATGGLIGAYYWLPALLTLDYSSPIYSFTQYMWFGGVRYLLVIVFLALTVAVVTRIKIRNDIRLDFLILCFCLAAALGFRATNYLPFGLGSLVQEFRFATIALPFFGIMLVLYPLKHRLVRLNAVNLAAALAISIFVIALLFGLDKREALSAGFKGLADPGIRDYYRVIAREFTAEFPGLAVTLLPYFAALVFLALSTGRKIVQAGLSRPAFVVAGGACILLVTSFIPYINTDQQNNFGRIFNYIDYYRQPEYGQILEAAQNGRLIQPPGKGFLIEGDSLVTYAWRWGVETVNGPYNQGDPKFFKSTVHLEWEERWLDFPYTRENLMHESAAKYIFIRGALSLPANMDGLTQTVSNNYGRLLELDQEVSYANRVTPVLIDVEHPREVTEFFNILLPGGYRMVLVNADDIPDSLKDKFDYVMLDQEANAAGYAGKTVFLLNNAQNPGISEDRGMIRLDFPYLDLSNRLFYHGDEADGYWWIGWDNWPGSRITNDIESTLNNIRQLMAPYADGLIYDPVPTERTDNRTAVAAPPGFTLVKDSYFPYWQSNYGDIMSTSQGFMLVYSDEADPVLRYKKPAYYILATVCTLAALLAAAAVLILIRIKRGPQFLK